jgi:hypothetical protein
MKPIFSAVWLLTCLSVSVLPSIANAASAQEPTFGSFQLAQDAPAKKHSEAKKAAAPIKKRAPIASKSKPASEVVKTELPPANLDLRLPKDMVEELKPVGTVPLPSREHLLPPMFGDKSSNFELNGRLISNEMQLQLRNEERHEVEGAALDFEFKH